MSSARNSGRGPLRASLACLFGAIVLIGCAHTAEIPKTAPTELPAGFPAIRYESGYADDGRVLRIVPADSEVRILVYREGRLAKLGHNHVLVSREVQGYVFLADTLRESRADLYFPVASLIVDDPADRAAAGDEFAGVPSEQAVAGTRRNLLGERVLEAERFPFIVLGAAVAGGDLERAALTLKLTIKDGQTTIPVDVEMMVTEQGIEIAGSFEVAQTKLGIEPYSVLGGALRVRDQIELRFSLTAAPIGG